MSRKTMLIFVALLASPLFAAVPWQMSLWQGGGGYWAERVPVTVTNPGTIAIDGEPVAVHVGTAAGQANLAGREVKALRVCDEQGREVLYDVRSAVGVPRRDGKFATGDTISFCVACDPGKTATYYLYTDNPDADAVLDFLSVGLHNPGFEQGGSAPADWGAWGTDSTHHVTWDSTIVHSGKRSGKVSVAAGGEPTWVKWQQTAIPVSVGAHYTVTGWVKGVDVKGDVGYFVHVDGVRSQMVSKTAYVGQGTFDWRQVKIEFDVPEGGNLLTIGTVLRGTGTAYYDDIALTSANSGKGTQVHVDPTETMNLARVNPGAAWKLNGEQWPYRGILSVINMSSQAQTASLVQADLNRLLHLADNGFDHYSLRALDPATDQPLAILNLGKETLIQTNIPARSRVDLPVYLSPQIPDAITDVTATYAKLLHSAANLARNGDFEADGGSVADWTSGVEGETGAKYETRIVTGGKFGEHAAMLKVAPDAAPKWIGFRQLKVPVKPNTTYFYGGWVKTGDLSGSTQLYGHCMTADGKLSAGSAYFSAGPQLGAHSDWTLLSSFIKTPADCASVELHLTTNSSGTIWYDGIVFCEADSSTLTGIDLSPAVAQRQPGPLEVWNANPLVKVFPEDPPQARVREVSISAARNEREPFELAVRGVRPLRNLRVTMGTLTSASGAALPPVVIHRVGFVPVDYPTSYYRSDLPDWYRRVPRANPGCDGWAGEWPDPLAPAKTMDLPANRTQPFWSTVSVPTSAAPGEYRGTATVQADGVAAVEVPVRLTVRSFALPDESHLQVIFDYRSGPGWNVHKNAAEERKWYQLQHAYRINTDHIFPSPKFDYVNGKVTMDATEFDKVAHYCLDELHMNAVYTPQFFYAFGWAYQPRPLFGHKAFTPEYVKIYTEALQLFMQHVREKGWADKFVNYVSDEPHDSVPGVIDNLARVCDIARKAEPKTYCYSSTWRYMPGLVGHLNLWGIGQYGCFPVDKMKERLDAGDKLWYTTDGQQCLDTPLLGCERLLPYYCFKYGVSGYEFWGLSWWTHDPWKYGWHKYIRQSSEGKNYFYVRYPNGDGYLTYPGEDVGVDGPVSSIRLAAIRDGIEDYEYLVLLQQRIAAAKKQGKPTAEGETALAAARALVEIPNSGGRYSTKIMPDPNAVYRVRDQVAKAIEDLR